MKASKRLLIQLLFWVSFWLASWTFQEMKQGFLIENSIVFLFQILFIAALVFYLAPSLLFKKKQLVFAIVSIGFVLIAAWISSSVFASARPLMGPRGLDAPPLPRGVLPRFYIHFLLISIAYILGTLVETFFYAQRKEEETIINKNETLQTELKLLKSQINPHFLFNSLNNIYALSVINSNKTQESISTLSDMLRYVLYECEQPFVPIRKEITYIENYIQLFSLKSSKPYPISLNIKLQNSKANIAPMLFIPFLENAFKHGHIENIKDSYINIGVETEANKVLFTIENSIPKKAVSKDDVGGIGLENVKKRLAIMYPNTYELTIKNANDKFKVELILYLNE